MKINVKFWIFIIVTSSIVIFLKNSTINFSKDKKYTFERTLCKEIIPTKNTSKELPKVDFYSIFTDLYICSYSFKKDSFETTYKMKYYDTDKLNKIKEFEFTVPNYSQILYCNSNNVFINNQFNLIQHTIDKKKTKSIKIDSFRVSKIISIDEKTSELLVFGEKQILDKYQTGFFIFNYSTNNLAVSKIIETNNKSKIIENSLIYSGNFSKNRDMISYTCNKFSSIFFFRNNGSFLKKITTKDNTPRPKLVSSNSAYYYKRGETYNTNNGVFVENDSVFVFSSRTKKVDVILIDIYSFRSNEYLCSTELSNNSRTSTDINFVTKSNGSIILGFDDGIFSFSL